jgi:hypothetical protein
LVDTLDVEDELVVETEDVDETCDDDVEDIDETELEGDELV